MVSWPFFAISNIAALCISFGFSNIVLCVFPSNILIIARPGISSMNGALTLIIFCCFGFNTIHSFGKMGKDLFKKLKQQSHEFITPSNSNMFLIPNTRSMFSWISDTNVHVSNLCLCMSTIIGIMNRTLTN